ncbi:molybdopterin-binding protein [Corynebacterium sp. A21]|uniref:molybdopterin-binding protein n=1 Tax=Corynebacterium sp. A21 TaxID=3457318 RepID=UPI003FD5CD50
MENLQHIRGAVIVVSDRCAESGREDTSGPAAVAALARFGVEVARVVVVREGLREVAEELRAAVDAGAQVILTVGGTGIGPRNLTPEATAPLLAVELPGVAMQILLAGLQSTPQAGLSRGLVGLTGRGPGAAVICNAPSSRGGVEDTIGVIGPLLPRLLERV